MALGLAFHVLKRTAGAQGGLSVRATVSDSVLVVATRINFAKKTNLASSVAA